MWKSLKDWKQMTTVWIDSKFMDINVAEIKAKAEYYTKIVNKCVKNMPGNPVLDNLKSLVYEFKDSMPVVVALRNKDLKEYHWEEIRKIIGKEFTIDDNFTLKNLIELDVMKNMIEI